MVQTDLTTSAFTSSCRTLVGLSAKGIAGFASISCQP